MMGFRDWMSAFDMRREASGIEEAEAGFFDFALRDQYFPNVAAMGAPQACSYLRAMGASDDTMAMFERVWGVYLMDLQPTDWSLFKP